MKGDDVGDAAGVRAGQACLNRREQTRRGGGAFILFGAED